MTRKIKKPSISNLIYDTKTTANKVFQQAGINFSIEDFGD